MYEQVFADRQRQIGSFVEWLEAVDDDLTDSEVTSGVNALPREVPRSYRHILHGADHSHS